MRGVSSVVDPMRSLGKTKDITHNLPLGYVQKNDSMSAMRHLVQVVGPCLGVPYHSSGFADIETHVFEDVDKIWWI